MPSPYRSPVYYFISKMEKGAQEIRTDKRPAHDNRETVICITGLKKSFGSKDVLKNINLELKKGENLVILGRSGTGKSVTIQCIVGLLKQDGGSLTVFSEEVAEMNERELKELRM